MSETGIYPPSGGGGGGNAITELTGDVTASGPGVAVATVAAIQGNTVTGTTGTGKVVFDTSPVLVAPAIGTPVSGNLSNCTNLPIVGGTTGILTVARGGTGTVTNTNHGVLLGQGTSAMAATAVGTTGQVLTGVTGADPVWAPPATSGTVTSVDVSGGTTGLTTTGGPVTSSGTITLAGTLSVPNGGTGTVTNTNHGVLLGQGTSNVAATAVGTTGQVLTGVTGADPVWAAPATAGTVTSVSGSGGTTGLTLTGGPITGSGTLTLGGTLAVANGGTGVTASTGSTNVVLSNSPVLVTPNLGTPSALVLTNATGLPVAGGGTGAATFTSNGVLVGNTTSAVTATAAGTTGQYLVGTTSSAPSWSSLGVIDANDSNRTITASGARNYTYTGFTASRDVTLPTTDVAAGDTWCLTNTNAFDMVVKSSNGSALTVANSANVDATTRQGFVVVQALQATPTTPAHWFVVDLSERYVFVSAVNSLSASAPNGTYRITRNLRTVVVNQTDFISSSGNKNNTSDPTTNAAVPLRFRPLTGSNHSAYMWSNDGGTTYQLGIWWMDTGGFVNYTRAVYGQVWVTVASAALAPGSMCYDY